MASVVDVLQERGFIAQFTHEEEIRELLAKEKITFYIGFDPTADSLHVGHFIAMMAMAHMQRFGHRPIALVGGGTVMVGDPSGRTDMRPMLTREIIAKNADCIRRQMEKFIDFSDGKAIMDNNANWLLELNYVNFLREVGTHFSVNRMLAAECFKSRMEQGLSFFEFNYMLMQGYDFYVLNEKYGCVMQMGGDDQWSNMIAGVELIRKKAKKPAYSMTFPLLTNSEGKKMGKTAKGALWLDPAKTTPYDFYQYWRNVEDGDVGKCLALLTFLPMDEVRRLGSLRDEKINEAKKVLAFEVTRLIHGEAEAEKARSATEALFSGGADMSHVPALTLAPADLGIGIVAFLAKSGALKTTSDGRRLIDQGGMSLNEQKVTSHDLPLTAELFKQGEPLVRLGKKKYYKLVLAEG
ncbi:MAG: tyrosine--tRNA ligase [Fusobacteriaceae bacterium]|jgi:tyrosyl-tRNA synthetase|nr:tyrosine--tRNA ligase [Fusobacteriaceae bacterium]